MAWAKEGIRTVSQAKEVSSTYHKNYFAILKALGIMKRNPVDAEKNYMDRWMKEWAMDLELILDACQRTILQTGQSSFPYADSILRDWHKKNIRHLSQTKELDAQHKSSKKTGNPQKTENTQRQAKAAGDYSHRSYDFETIRKSMFDQ